MKRSTVSNCSLWNTVWSINIYPSPFVLHHRTVQRRVKVKWFECVHQRVTGQLQWNKKSLCMTLCVGSFTREMGNIYVASLKKQMLKYFYSWKTCHTDRKKEDVLCHTRRWILSRKYETDSRTLEMIKPEVDLFYEWLSISNNWLTLSNFSGGHFQSFTWLR